VHRYVMSDDPTSTYEVIIRSTGGRRLCFCRELNVFKCKPCAFFNHRACELDNPAVVAERSRTAENIGRRSKPAGRVTKTNAAIHRCPNTGLQQGLAPDDDESERADNIFVGVTRLARGLVHFVNPNPGKRVDEERMERRA
jgi:hypothetical protein